MGSSELGIGRPGEVRRFEGDPGETNMPKSCSDKELVYDAFLFHLSKVVLNCFPPSPKNRK
jgi:hypothetical protein